MRRRIVINLLTVLKIHQAPIPEQLHRGLVGNLANEQAASDWTRSATGDYNCLRGARIRLLGRNARVR
jgi:hypothetical protein